MLIVTNRLLSTLIATVLLVPAAPAGDSTFTGAFTGTGRACYGALYIKTRTISWLTSFSQCQKVPYEVIERVEKGNRREFVFRLKPHKKICEFNVLYLRHPDTPDMSLDWEIIGYASLEGYEADKRNGYKAPLPDSLSCALVTR